MAKHKKNLFLLCPGTHPIPPPAPQVLHKLVLSKLRLPVLFLAPRRGWRDQLQTSRLACGCGPSGLVAKREVRNRGRAMLCGTRDVRAGYPFSPRRQKATLRRSNRVRGRTGAGMRPRWIVEWGNRSRKSRFLPPPRNQRRVNLPYREKLPSPAWLSDRSASCSATLARVRSMRCVNH